MKTETLEINAIKYVLKIFYEEREYPSASIRKKSINIRIPISMDRNQQFVALLKMKQWVKKNIEKNPPKKEIKRVYTDGEILKIGESEYKLHITFASKQSSSARISENNIYLSISSDLPKEIQDKHVSVLLSRSIGRQRIGFIEDKIKKLNEMHFNQKVNKIFFKNHQSKWGSCSNNNNLNISTRLLFAPNDVLEYICIHELAHLIEHNHSENFWNLVEKAMPDYKEKERWLKENGKEIGF